MNNEYISLEAADDADFLVIPDVHSPETDFIAVRPDFDSGIIEFMIVDQTNDPNSFSSMDADAAVEFAQAILHAAQLVKAVEGAKAYAKVA